MARQLLNTASGGKMNIVLNKISGKCLELVEYLTGLPDIGLYLAVSQEDTLRIIQLNHPDAVIFCRSQSEPDGFIDSLYHTYPTLQIYLYVMDTAGLTGIELLNLTTLERISLDRLLPGAGLCIPGGMPNSDLACGKSEFTTPGTGLTKQIQTKIDKTNSKE